MRTITAGTAPYAQLVRAGESIAFSDIVSAPAPVEQPDDTSWMLEAACRGKNTEIFFPTAGRSGRPSAAYRRAVTTAKSICKTCVVKYECGQVAAERPEHYGVWGGEVETGRPGTYANNKRLAQERRRTKRELAQLAGAAVTPPPVSSSEAA